MTEVKQNITKQKDKNIQVTKIKTQNDRLDLDLASNSSTEHLLDLKKNEKRNKLKAATYRKFVSDSSGRSHNWAGCVMLHHSGELCQVSLYEF